MPFDQRVRILPQDDASSGWNEPLPARPPSRSLRGEVRADTAVIGAGFTGLAIARRLAEVEPDWRIAILEAQRVGSGASGRASGFVVDLTDFASRMPLEAMRLYVEVAGSGIADLRRLVRDHDLDCDWDETGWIRAAGGEEGQRFLDAFPSLYEPLEIDYERLDRDRMHAITGTSFYRAGMRLPGYPLVHSAALVRGLAQTLPKSIELYEESPVLRIRGGNASRIQGGSASPLRGENPFRIETEHGSVIADRILLATNGYTPALGFLPRRIFPLYTFGSFTRPLTDAEQQALSGDSEWGLLAMDPMGSTVRRTRDQRILIRNTSFYSRKLRVDRPTRERMRQFHRQAFDQRFPMLPEAELEYTWAGLMGTSHNGQISFGELRPGLFVAAGYTAAGIAMGTAAGRLLAELAAGVDSPHLRFVLDLPKPTWMPPDPFRSLGGWWLNERMNAKAGPYL
ncbi:MAG: FAD-binding oxidoreductase [Acidobacteriota bacterium]